MTRHLITVLRLAAMTVPLLLAGQSVRSNRTQREKWKEYTFPDDSFAITLPERVDPHEDSTLSPATFKAFTVSTTYIYTVRLADGLVLSLHVVTFPGGCSDFISKLRAAMADPGKIGIHVDPSESDKVTEVADIQQWRANAIPTQERDPTTVFNVLTKNFTCSPLVGLVVRRCPRKSVVP